MRVLYYKRAGFHTALNCVISAQRVETTLELNLNTYSKYDAMHAIAQIVEYVAPGIETFSSRFFPELKVWQQGFFSLPFISAMLLCTC
jgi:hypothetical protein